MGTTQHISRHGNRWALRGQGGTRVFETRGEAIDHALQRAGSAAADVIVRAGDSLLVFETKQGNEPLVPMAWYLEARRGFQGEAEMAATLGEDEERLAAWGRGEDIDEASARLLRDLSVVVSELLDLYDAGAIPAWLTSRAPDELKTPMQWLREGNLAEVLQLINAAASGAYS